MRKLGLAVVVTLLAVLALPPSGRSQRAKAYEAERRANPKDVYCSGFYSSTRLPADLRVVMAEDRVGGMTYGTNDFIYLSHGTNAGLQPGTKYLVVRPYNDPDNVQGFRGYGKPGQASLERSMGTLYQDIGRVEVKYVHETTATALVVQECDGINAGDVLIPFEERPAPEYKQSAGFNRFESTPARAEGTVVTGKEYIQMMGTGDIIYVNLGASHGLKVGDYLRLFRYARGTEYRGFDKAGRGQPRKLRGMPRGYEIPKMRKDLPREVLGEAFVVRVGENSATAVVIVSVREIHAGDFAELE